MGVRLRSLMGTLALIASSTVFAASAEAQERPATFKPRETLPDAVDRAFDAPVAEHRGPKVSLESLIGLTAFPENGIARDLDHLHRLYRDVLNQQVSGDPLIRTADLPNPYDTSVLTLPSASVSSRVLGSELVFEKLPER